ncbi:MAG: type II toxin-antitoxin system ParD family antitoxin [Magnetococcus sp. YQC-5]
MIIDVSLTQELESFVQNCVNSGRFHDLSEVIHSALRLLRTQENRRNQFTALLDTIQQDTQREGFYTLDEILSEMDEVIAQTVQ